MRILLHSQYGEGLYFGLRLQAEGHTVSYYIQDKHYEHMLDGLIHKPLVNFPNTVSKKNEPEHVSVYDLILFDYTGDETVALADRCKLHSPTIGHSTLAHKLEKDRQYGIEVMEECGIEVPWYEIFDSIDKGKKYIKDTRKRYVFKPFGTSKTETTFVAKDKESRDLLRFMDDLSGEVASDQFLLQEFETGEEVSVEGWFDGKEFYFINFTLEEKKFMNDNIGPNTGCSGNLVGLFDSFESNKMPKVFIEGLEKIKDFLTENHYTGMIDLNSIVNDGELFGLEWTPRFGYDASATLLNLIGDNHLGDFLLAIASGNGDATIGMRTIANFGASVRLSVPPYPNDGESQPGIPIMGLEEDDLCDCYVHDCMLEKGELVTAGGYGFVAAPLTSGHSPQEAFDVLDKKVKTIQIPNVMYRSDIGKSTMKRYQSLKNLGWF